MEKKLVKITFTKQGSTLGDLYGLCESEDGGENWTYVCTSVVCHAAEVTEQSAAWIHRSLLDELRKLIREGYTLIEEG